MHPDIGRIKDMASAAVGMALADRGLHWLLAIVQRLGLPLATLRRPPVPR